jgi:hypothetical protein
MDKYSRVIFLGFLSWLIPFVASVFFVDQSGNYLVPEALFKSVMVVSGVLTGTYLAVRYFKKVKADYVREGWLIGLVWFAINIFLDLITLVGLFKMSLGDYFMGVGLRYLSIPIITVGLGYALKRK